MIRDYAGGPVPNGAIQARRERSRGRPAAALALRLGAAAAALLALGSLGWESTRALVRSPYFRLREVAVEGNLLLSAEEVVRSLDLPPEAGALEVDLRDLAARLTRNPWIREASVRRQLPLGLAVQIVERAPEMVLVADRPYLLAADGVVLAALSGDEAPEAPALPVFRAPRGRTFAPGDRVYGADLARGLAVWRQFHLAHALQGQPAQEIALEGDGTFRVNLGPGMPVVRIRGDDLETQLARLEAVLARASRPLAGYAYIDLRFGDRVVVKPAEGG